MTSETLEANPESPEAKYEKLLLAGIETNKKLNALDEDEDYKEIRISYQIDKELSQRVEALKKSGIATIDSQFPEFQGELAGSLCKKISKLRLDIADKKISILMRKKDEEKEKKVNEKIGKMEDEVQALQKKIEPLYLADEQIERFHQAVEKLASENGYEINYEPLEKLLELERNGVIVSMQYFEDPISWPKGGGSRITKMWVGKSEDGLIDGEPAYDDGTWHEVTEDPEVQKEIDRVVAIFG